MKIEKVIANVVTYDNAGEETEIICSMDRVNDLEQSTGNTFAEMLSKYAEYCLDCDDCLIKRKCLRADGTNRDCDELWLAYLEGKI